MATGCRRAATSHEMRNNRYFELSHDVVCACAKRDEPLISASHAYGSWLMDGSPLPRSGFIPPSQQTMNIELPHDVVCACAKRDEPPQPPEPFSSFVINILFHFEILSDVVGPAARHFVRLMVKFVCIRVHSWLKINDLVAANDRFKKNQCNLCDLWFP